MNLSTVFSSRRSAFLLSRMFLLFVFTVGMMTPAALRGQGPLPVTTAVVGPVTPTYIDPVSLAVTVTSSTGTVATGTITYTVDAGAVQTATVSNGAALIQLGMFAPGAHAVTYLYNGNVGATVNVEKDFTVTDVAFSLQGSEQTVIYNQLGFVSIAPDSQNNMYLTNANESNVYKLDAQRNLTVVPTSGLSGPQGITLDAADNLYIADYGNNRVVKMTPAGVQTTLPFTGLAQPANITFDGPRANLYVSDLGNARIVMLNLATGTQTTVVTGIPRITGMAFDLAGNFYFGQSRTSQNGTLYRLDTAGNLVSGLYGLTSPRSLVTDINGNFYVSDDSLGTNKIDLAGHLTHIDDYFRTIGVDSGGQLYELGVYTYVFTPGSAAKFANTAATGLGGAKSTSALIYQIPYTQGLTSLDITTGGNGNLAGNGVTCQQLGECNVNTQFGPSSPGPHAGYVVATLSNHATLQNNFYGVGFNSNEAFDPGTRTSAATTLMSAGGLAEAEDGTIYVTDTAAQQVYSLGVGGTSAAVALPFTGLTAPTQLAVDGSKNVFVLDGASRILKLTPAGVQSTAYTVARGILATVDAMALDGNGNFFLGGPLQESTLYALTLKTPAVEYQVALVPGDPTALAVDGVGGVYEADATTSTVRRYPYYGGTGQLGTATVLASGVGTPVAMTVEPSGTVFVAQGSAGTLLQVRPDGSATTLYSGLGAASAVVEDGRGVLTLMDGAARMLYLDDRRTGAYNFGTQLVGSTSAALPGTISDDGNQVLQGIDGLPGDKTFTQVAETGACFAGQNTSTSLLPGAFCKLDYTFSPSTVGLIAEAGTEEDATPTSGTTFTFRTVNFSGTGSAGSAAATLTPPVQDFGGAAVGMVSPSNFASFTLSNIGSVALSNTVALTGANAAYFSIASNTCASPLAAGARCTIGVQFAPAATGSFAATLAVTSVAGATTLMESSALTGNGTPGPMLTATPNPVMFPDTQSGATAAPLTVTLTNTGGTILHLNGTTLGTLGGTDAGNFASTGNSCGYSLAAGASCPVSFTFTPNAVRTFNATFSVPSDDPNSPTVIALTGKGLAAGRLTISPVVQAFPSTVIGSVSAVQTSVISNTTTQAIYLSAGTLTDATDFTQSNNCNGLLAANATCTVTFTFQPQTTGALSSVYSIYDLNHPASPLTVALSGNGAGVAAATLYPGSVSFSAPAGTIPPIQGIELNSTGTAPLILSSIAITGPNAPVFNIVTNGCGANGTSLAPNTNCQLILACTATAAGKYTATLTFTDNASPATQSAALICQENGTPQATLTPATASFGSVAVGVSSAAQTFTLSNSGTAALAVAAVNANGPGFVLSANNCPVSLAAGASCTILVSFVPTSAGPASGTLSVVDTVGTQTSTLSGTGTSAADFTLTSSPSSQSTYKGTTVNYTITLSSVGGGVFTGPAALTASGLPSGATLSFAPATVSSSANTSTMTITVPALVGSNAVERGSIAFASLIAVGLLFTRRRRLLPRLLLLLLALTVATFVSGCGTGAGFGIPTTTSTITVTGTSGALTHTTSVMLTVK